MKVINRVAIRTHGGLGNQLFQLFYALLNNSRNIAIYHDDRYDHKFKLQSDLKSLANSDISTIEIFIFKTRILKIKEKIGVKNASFYFNKTLYLDGYFQDSALYQNFDKKIFSESINVIKKLIKPNNILMGDFINHIRLADFYVDNEARLLVARKKLSCTEFDGSFITTNDDLVSSDNQCNQIIRERRLNFLKTVNMDSLEVLRLMSTYKNIRSNNSTIAFWASILGGRNLEVSDSNLKSLKQLFENKMQ